MNNYINNNCDYCGVSNWNISYTDFGIFFKCNNCNHAKCIQKQDLLNNFKCDNCNNTFGDILENKNEIYIICKNCSNKYVVFDKSIININLKGKDLHSINKSKTTIETPVACPKCLSTQITTGARGVNALWGFFGASKTVNRCAKCGYTWKPHK